MTVSVKYNTQWLSELAEFLYGTHSEQSKRKPGSLIREAAKRAADEQMQPIPVDAPQGEETKVRILASEQWFKAYQADHSNIAEDKLILGAANAYLISGDNLNEHSNSILPLPGMDRRPQQIELANFLTHDGKGKPYKICEASTGIGKGMALVSAAIQTKQSKPNHQVVVAAPTLAILDQLHSDYVLFEKHLNLTYNSVKTLSSAEFLSKRLALFWCEEYADHPERDPFYEKINSTSSWRLSEFDAFKDIPLHELTVFNDYSQKDPGYEEFKSNKSDTVDADILFCTHSMIALSVLHGRKSTQAHRLDWSHYETLRDKNYQESHVSLPYHYFDNRLRIDSAPKEAAGFFKESPFYFIDEAHLLTELINLVSSDSVSLAKLTSALESYRKTEAQKLKAAIADFINSVPTDFERRISLRGSSKSLTMNQHEREIHSTLQEFIKSYSGRQLEKTLHGRFILKCAYSFKAFASDTHDVSLATSPVKKYLRIESGSASESMVTDFLAYSASGMSFTSATLHVPTTKSALCGYSYIANRLSLPFNQTQTHPPIISDWLTENVDLITVPNSEEHNPKHCDFYTGCASHIEQQSRTASGGTMVLCTSYEQIDSIAAALDSERVIRQKQGQPVKLLAERYLNAYKRGERPIWLATGAAWTGLDITDSDALPVNDNAIQQLFIVKLPFEHTSDGNKMNFHDVMAKCLFRLKQGVGRLVRRPGRQNMKIVILDGRLYSPQHRYKVIQDYLTANYKQHELESETQEIGS